MKHLNFEEIVQNMPKRKRDSSQASAESGGGGPEEVVASYRARAVEFDTRPDLGIAFADAARPGGGEGQTWTAVPGGAGQNRPWPGVENLADVKAKVNSHLASTGDVALCAVWYYTTRVTEGSTLAHVTIIVRHPGHTWVVESHHESAYFVVSQHVRPPSRFCVVLDMAALLHVALHLDIAGSFVQVHALLPGVKVTRQVRRVRCAPWFTGRAKARVQKNAAARVPVCSVEHTGERAVSFVGLGAPPEERTCASRSAAFIHLFWLSLAALPAGQKRQKSEVEVAVAFASGAVTRLW